MGKNCKEILEEAKKTCGLYTSTKTDKINFTKNKDLFSLGDSHLKTSALCSGGKCLISYEINDAFIDAKDIHDTTPGNQDYWGATPYDIHYNSVVKCGY